MFVLGTGRMKKVRFVLLFFITSISIAISASVVFGPDWQTADRSSVGIAPDPAIESAAIVQVYHRNGQPQGIKD